MKNQKMQRLITVRIDNDFYKEIKESNMHISRVVRDALELALHRTKKARAKDQVAS